EDCKVYSQCREMFEKLNLPMCLAQNDRILKDLGNNIENGFEFSALQTELYNSMVDECNISYFMSFSPLEWQWLSPDKPLFGKKVEDMLSNISEDIQEAAACVGFHRPTAAVFHLMRIMEIGVQKF